jgi:hypothetical protein
MVANGFYFSMVARPSKLEMKNILCSETMSMPLPTSSASGTDISFQYPRQDQRVDEIRAFRTMKDRGNVL